MRDRPARQVRRGVVHARRLAPAVLALAFVTLSLVGCSRASSAPPPPGGDTSATSVIRFDSVASTSGIRYRWPQQPKPMNILESFGHGCAFLDYDGDGWQDILLMAVPRPLLFRNRRDGTFEDVTAATGLDRLDGSWRGCAVGDVDGDGRVDLLLSGYRCLALLHNDEGKRWVDVTRAAGLDPHNRRHWGASAGFMDLDGDGRLDLVLLNYVVYGPELQQYCEWKVGVTSGCGPNEYAPEYPELWHNTGGRFREVTSPGGLSGAHGKAMVLAFADVDDDGRMDFFIGNDGWPSDLMRNEGGMRFKNIGEQSGVAYGSVPGQAISAMAADFADYDGDGRLDLVVTAFSNQPYSLLRRTGPGVFEHAGDRAGISGPTFRPLGFGAKFLDMDNDGWPDIAFANGHVHDNTERIDPLTRYREPMMLFQNQHGRHFTDVVPDIGGAVAAPIVGRGLAAGDFDNDGRTDLLVVDMEGEPLLLHNQTRPANHWLTLDLRGAGANGLAYGAKITAQGGERRWIGCVSPASSFLSSSDPRVHFGLGGVSKIDTLAIDWPDRRHEVLRIVSADQIMRVREGHGAAGTAGGAGIAP